MGSSHFPIDLYALGADVAAFSGHKMFAATGIGGLWIHPRLQAQCQPVFVGGGMHSLLPTQTTKMDLSQKLEAGTLHLEGIISLGAAIDFVNMFGRQEITMAVNQLTYGLLQRIRNIPAVELLPGIASYQCAIDSAGILAFRIAGKDSAAIGDLLNEHGICVRTTSYCSSSCLYDDSIRVSLHAYNTVEEISRFIAALLAIV